MFATTALGLGATSNRNHLRLLWTAVIGINLPERVHGHVVAQRHTVEEVAQRPTRRGVLHFRARSSDDADSDVLAFASPTAPYRVCEKLQDLLGAVEVELVLGLVRDPKRDIRAFFKQGKAAADIPASLPDAREC